MRCIKCSKKRSKAKDRKEWVGVALIPNRKEFVVCPKHIAVVPVLQR